MIKLSFMNNKNFLKKSNYIQNINSQNSAQRVYVYILLIMKKGE